MGPNLEVNKIPFLRDSAFYLLSIILLTWTLWDGVVSPTESLVLVICCGLFVCSVIYTDKIVEVLALDMYFDESAKEPLLDSEKAELPTLKIAMHNRLADSKAEAMPINLIAGEDGIYTTEPLRTGELGASMYVNLSAKSFSGIMDTGVSALGLSKAGFFGSSARSITSQDDLDKRPLLPFQDVLLARNVGSSKLLLDCHNDVTMTIEWQSESKKAQFMSEL